MSTVKIGVTSTPVKHLSFDDMKMAGPTIKYINLESQLREAYFTLWAAVENGIDTDTFFKLRETFRGIQSMIEEDDCNPPRPRYSPECFDGRFFKWDGYVLDSMTEGVDDNIMTLTIDGKILGDFHFPPEGYEHDQEGYLNDALETVKNWIVEQKLFPPMLQKQNS